MDNKPCVIEFQAFRGNNNRFIIKELVILDLLSFVAYPFLFEAPYSFNKLNAKAKATNKWITRHFHHIQWYEGYITYTNLHSIMYNFCTQFTHIYTRGLEKRNWIKQYTYANVFDITINKSFQYHFKNMCISAKNPKHGQTQCALHNAYRLAVYLKQEQGIGGGSGGYKYQGATQPQHEYYSRLRRGNISEDTINNDGITTVSPVLS